ncbi:helix-turn-helix domain-containing protein [Tautonia plasticadhaerens]|uniref:Uncharacterized protein n=1 Tax=Tautonia plasticadhaerens TaxID=2527974 RepID=A0A518H902_9BACT|nr:helix-turn-helix transcriptional regulator [Tautonia plasticadhaerens]QDV37332.1 hypothetical protein ElP_52680 [Tautonia plasticadhaerens]
MAKKLSEQLAELIKNSGNYSEIARKAGLDPSQVARIAKGERTGRKDTLDQIGQAMNLNLVMETRFKLGAAMAGKLDDDTSQEIREILSQCRGEIVEARKELAKATRRLEGMEQALDNVERLID